MKSRIEFPASAPRWCFVPMRVYLGAAFLSAASNKVGDNWRPWPGWMSGVIQQRLPTSFPMYRAFLSDVVLPHVQFFAHFVAAAELVVGCCLLVGLATRPAAVAGAFLTLNYLMLNGIQQLIPKPDPIFAFGSNDPIFILGCVGVFVAAAGRVLGFDHFLFRRFPRMRIW